MKRNKILVSLLALLFMVGAANLLFAGITTRPLDYWDASVGPSILLPRDLDQYLENPPIEDSPKATATIKDEDGMAEISIVAKGLEAKCAYNLGLSGLGDVQRGLGGALVTDENGVGSYIFSFDSKILDEWKMQDIYPENEWKVIDINLSSRPSCAKTDDKVLVLDIQEMRSGSHEKVGGDHTFQSEPTWEPLDQFQDG